MSNVLVWVGSTTKTHQLENYEDSFKTLVNGPNTQIVICTAIRLMVIDWQGDIGIADGISFTPRGN